MIRSISVGLQFGATCTRATLVAGLLSITLFTACKRDAASAAAPAATTQARQVKAPESFPFTIKGDVSGLAKVKDGDLIQLYVDDAKFADADGKPAPLTATVTQGHFEMKGEVSTPTTALLKIPALGYQGYFGMIVEKADYTVQVSGPDVVVIGGHYNDQVYGHARSPEYVAYRSKQQAREDAAFKGLDRTDEAAVQRAIKKAYVGEDIAARIRNEETSKLIDDTTTEPLLRLFALGVNGDHKRFSYDRRLSLLDEIEKAIGPNPSIARQRMMVTNLRDMNSKQEAVAIGKQYKDVTGLDADGKPVKLSNVLAKHKLVLLDFWASWCGPCRDEFPHLARLRKEYPGQLEVFSISRDDAKDAWLKALKEEGAKHDVGWVNLIEFGEENQRAGDIYGVLGLPDNYLIAQDGTVLGKQLYREALDAAIAKQLGQPKAPNSK